MTTAEKCRCRVHDVFSDGTVEDRPGPWAIRRDFPLIDRRPLIYLDNAATTHKPSLVLDAEHDFNVFHNANAHAGGHRLAREATEILRDSRRAVAEFVGAAPDEIVFTKSATEALNLVARVVQDAGRVTGPDDEIVITELEHHANIIPWQMLAERTGAVLRRIPVSVRASDHGRLDLTGLDEAITPRTRIVALCHESNVCGTITSPAPLVARARAVGALTVLDACQSIAHMPVHLPSLDVDLAVFSGHKMYGPTGIGALWGRRGLLADLPPYLGGAHMEDAVTPRTTTYAPPPARFEAGTPMVAQALALAAACRYLQRLDRDALMAHESRLTEFTLRELRDVPGIRVIGPRTAELRGPVVSFTMRGRPAADVGANLDRAGIAVRTGDMSASPLCERFRAPELVRASYGIYTVEEEVAALVAALHDMAAGRHSTSRSAHDSS
ncbi:aminotransferase class V-fold PLP-dependent enzyme [Actinomadura terrae]|uniref:aminotransferase class V-fold PLP-dependent enzyme n=1 Tax=Actinomadura terrae TaxID=604353 RepID=UPI001FA80151|nr:aminotransferase class V-fold PLP-dependent enzyme [Actinomadura terrae]